MNGSKSIIIDANAVARISQYIDACEFAGVDIGSDLNTIKRKLSSMNISIDFLDLEHIKDGNRAFNYLLDKIKNDDAEILFSLYSEMELLGVFLKSYIEEELRIKKIPHRIRRRNPFRIQANFNYEDKVWKYWEKHKEILSDNGIVLTYPEFEDKIRDIIKTAFIISKYFSFEQSSDLYLYSLGIFYMVDEIYTLDSLFRNFINDIRDKDDYNNIRIGIFNDLIKSFPKFKEISDVISNPKEIFPKGVH